MKVVIANASEEELQAVRAEFPAHEFVAVHEREQAPAAAADAEVYIGGWVTPDLVDAARHLKWVQTGAAGVNHLPLDRLRAHGIVLTHGNWAVPMADHLMGWVLAFSRAAPAFLRKQAAHEWAKWDSLPMRDLEGDTLGILGVGQIGRTLAPRAAAFGMRVIGIRRTPEAVPGVAEMRGPEALDWLLAESDFLAICAPSTAATRHLIDAGALRKMKRTAVLMNVARGALVDEAALAEALRDGIIAGAALDVFETEPLPLESPLWDLPNVLITSHNAGSSAKNRPRYWAIITDNLRRYFAGEPLRNVVDYEAGY